MRDFGTAIRYRLGSGVNLAVHHILSRRWFPLTRYVPRGSYVWYDVQRFAGTRDLRTLFDVGANIGQTAYSLTRYFPSADLYCFEPAKGPFAALRSKYGHLPNVRCVHAALGARRETLPLYVNQNSELNTLVKDGYRGHHTVEEAAVDTIDGFCEANSIEAIDILKIDVQGWEIEVLDGARRMISHGKVRFVFAEVGFGAEENDVTPFCELPPKLLRDGFHFCGLYDAFRWGPIKDRVYFGNVLYAYPRFQSLSSLKQ